MSGRARYLGAMLRWACPLLSCVLAACSSTSTNESAGGGGASGSGGGGTGGAATGGMGGTGGAGTGGTGSGGGVGGVSACTELTCKGELDSGASGCSTEWQNCKAASGCQVVLLAYVLCVCSGSEKCSPPGLPGGPARQLLSCVAKTPTLAAACLGSACVPPGDHCEADKDCCGGSACHPQNQTCCSKAGADCAQPTDCCSGKCVMGDAALGTCGL